MKLICPWSSKSKCAPSSLTAFSLIELLCVIAVIGILGTIAGPALSSLGSSGNVNKAGLNISLMLEQARTYALANNTRVWVGFHQEDGTLTVTSVAGTTGASDDIVSANTIRPIMKPRGFEHVSLGTVTGLDGMVAGVPLAPNGSMTFSQISRGKNETFEYVIQFEPGGGARLAADTIPRWIQIGLLPDNTGNGNESAIQVAGLSGKVRVFRR